jgi:hypothetical protein
MNDKIRELAVEAGLVDFVGEIKTKKTEELKVEKFAEMLIKECADQCVRRGIDKCIGGDAYSKKIKKHFGVEE